MTAVYYEYDRKPDRLHDLGWNEVMLVGRGGNPLEKRTYWVKSSEMCGDFMGI